MSPASPAHARRAQPAGLLPGPLNPRPPNWTRQRRSCAPGHVRHGHMGRRRRHGCGHGVSGAGGLARLSRPPTSKRSTTPSANRGTPRCPARLTPTAPPKRCGVRSRCPLREQRRLRPRPRDRAGACRRAAPARLSGQGPAATGARVRPRRPPHACRAPDRYPVRARTRRRRARRSGCPRRRARRSAGAHAPRRRPPGRS